MDKVEEVIPPEQRRQLMGHLASEETAMALSLVKMLDGLKNDPERLENEETRVLKKALAALAIDPNSTTLTTEQLDLLNTIKREYGNQSEESTQ